MNVLLVAEEAAGIQVLRMLADSRHRIVSVLTAPQTRGGGATVASAAEALGLPVRPSELVRDPAFADWMRAERVDVLLNIHSLFLINAEVVTAPAIGSFNLHPGPLPEYAGLSIPSWAIYHGERQHAVTLHWMAAGIDTGAVAYQAPVEISESDTGLSLSLKCVRAGLPLVERLLQDVAEDQPSIPATAQDLSRRRYFGRDAPDEGRIRWSATAREIVDLVRASNYRPFPSPWGQPIARHGDRTIGITRASRTGMPCVELPGTVGLAGEGAVDVATGDEWVRVHRLAVDGEGVAAADVLHRGSRLDDGARS